MLCVRERVGAPMRGVRAMVGLDWRAIEAAKLVREPFDHIALNEVLEPDCASAISHEYPAIQSPGSFSLTDAPPGPVLNGLIADLLSQRFRTQMERIFEVDLEGRPAVVTLRGQCSSRDGRIHTDSKSKILSLLLYLNADWVTGPGQLRLLRSESDIDAYAVEIPASLGSLVVFRRTDNSWHGHTPFVGQRRVLQLNYLQSTRASLVGVLRHRLSALSKRRAA
jgi:SM-20-related protein